MKTQNATISKTIWIDLGFIGSKADNIKALFPGYSETPNEYGFYLKISGYVHLGIKAGVAIETNCWDTEEEFKQHLYEALLCNL